ncbi:hypothetical protein PCASD_20856 [Puccinia coronata f. sp. avenae]|uniref:Uncharacterized protein n=2 Tax=Puccinia coronata f. sp. avenae TaxID=200324 RepID=A0A2N5U590_9BASI|nr:hypothetical protein PCASD_20856 [Puccinia coronata f. sp. avenae]
MPTKFKFTPAQLQWLQEKQIWLEKLVVECFEPENIVVSQTDQYEGKGRDYYLWQSHCVCQAHLNAQARGLDMPTWAAPDVKAAWNAVRNRLGRGPIQFDGPSPEEIVWNYGREPTGGNTIKAMVTRR